MVTISPVGLAAAPVANQLSVLAIFKEKLCRMVCVNSNSQPQVTIVYTAGTSTLVDSTVFVPITATVTVVTPGCGCKATTQLFNEKFVAAFQGRTELPTSVTIASVGRVKNLSNLCCNKAGSVTVNDSLTITIA